MPVLQNVATLWRNLTKGGVTRVPQGIPSVITDIPPSDGPIPKHKKGYVSGIGDPVNLSRSDLTAEKVQSAIVNAERGNTQLLFRLYRDAIASYAHIQTELGKRKMAVLSKIQTIAPYKKKGEKTATSQANDAAMAIDAMICDCQDWERGLSFLMDSCLYPVMVAEKLFRVPEPGDEAYKLGLRWTLNKIDRVDPFLYCFQLPYSPLAAGLQESAWDPDAWESDLAFYSTLSLGTINWNLFQTYPADPDRHLVYRGNFLTSQRDNWGGPMRAVLLWWFCATKGRDWWFRFMERFGVPFVSIKADMQDVNVANMAKQALSSLTKLFGIAVNRDAEVQIEQAATANTAEAWDRWVSFCHMEISKIIVGQTLSSKPQGTGLGSGVANLQADVREDIRAYDELTLCKSLKRQLFRQCLDINGMVDCPAPNILWGGMSESDQERMSVTLANLANAGLEVDDEAIDNVSHKLGLQMRRKVEPVDSDGGPDGDKKRTKGKAAAND